MSRVVIGYLDGHTIYRDDGPGQARIANRGGLALGQALTAASGLRPVGEPQVAAPRKVHGLRGESVLNRKRP